MNMDCTQSENPSCHGESGATVTVDGCKILHQVVDGKFIPFESHEMYSVKLSLVLQIPSEKVSPNPKKQLKKKTVSEGVWSCRVCNQ